MRAPSGAVQLQGVVRRVPSKHALHNCGKQYMAQPGHSPYHVARRSSSDRGARCAQGRRRGGRSQGKCCAPPLRSKPSSRAGELGIAPRSNFFPWSPLRCPAVLSPGTAKPFAFVPSLAFVRPCPFFCALRSQLWSAASLSLRRRRARTAWMTCVPPCPPARALHTCIAECPLPTLASAWGGGCSTASARCPRTWWDSCPSCGTRWPCSRPSASACWRSRPAPPRRRCAIARPATHAHAAPPPRPIRRLPAPREGAGKSSRCHIGVAGAPRTVAPVPCALSLSCVLSTTSVRPANFGAARGPLGQGLRDQSAGAEGRWAAHAGLHA